MSTPTISNKRVAKNTLLLYFRMLLTMAISLYTSRIVLEALGVEDYGIYNVVGGVVAMFSILSGSLSSSISRFITFELGKGDNAKVIKVFSCSIQIQIVLATIIVILGETIGLYFLTTKLIIPYERLFAAQWVYHLSLLTFIINLLSIPYNATIIAHEDMSAFALVSILEVSGKLLIAYLIMVSPIDKLIFYSILLTINAIIVRLAYTLFCKKKYIECSFHFIYDKEIFKKMFGFAQWSLIGNSAGIMRNQGVNILLNLYGGPVINAANGIANQVCTAASSFANNFIIAVNPQIIKSFSLNEVEQSADLVKSSSRLSFMLLLLIVMPILVECEYVLSLWLKDVPQYAPDLVSLSLLMILFESISLPLISMQNATGKIRNYQMVVGVLHLLNFPFSWLALSLGAHPVCVYIIGTILVLVCFYARLYMLKRIVKIISIKDFTIDVFIRCIVIFILSYICIQVEKMFIVNKLIMLIFSIATTIVFIYSLGMKNKERIYLVSKLFKKYR